MLIESIEVGVSRLPLPCGEWRDQIHTVSCIEIVVIDVYTDSGINGTGISHTSGVGGLTIASLVGEIAPQLLGKKIQPSVLWDWSWRYLHDCGGGGITTLALSGFDLAYWDLLAKERNVALVDLLGRRRDRVPLYGSGINLNLSTEELVAQVEGWVKRGYKAGKVKVGKPELDEDVERLAAIRRTCPGFPLMVDANQGWSLAEAVRRIRAFEKFDLVWVEEPLIIDDLDAYEWLAERVNTPIALGENVYTVEQFKQFMGRQAVEYVQADVARVGGVTPYLRVSELAAAYRLPMAPHFILEISAEVLGAVGNAYLAEDTMGGTLTELGAVYDNGAVRDGAYSVGGRAGLGVEWRRERLRESRIVGSEQRFG